MVSWNYQSDVSEQGVRKRLAQMALVSRYEHCILLGLSVQFIRSVVSDSLWPYELQHTRPPCPSPTPRVYSNSCPSTRWCHPAISSSVVPFSSCPQSLPASGSFPMSQLFTWGSQSIGVSRSASVLPVNTQDWSPLGWTWLNHYKRLYRHKRILYSPYPDVSYWYETFKNLELGKVSDEMAHETNKFWWGYQKERNLN